MVGNLTNLLVTIKGLPLTYNRDLQEDKPPVFDSFDQLSICLAVTAGALDGAVINEDQCRAAASDPLLLATDLADYLVEQGVPFRQAHHVVGALVSLAEEKRFNFLSFAMQMLCPSLPSWEPNGGRSLTWIVPLPSGRSRECPGLSK